MEAQGGAEVRRLHIVYYLSRKGGRIEHPHLIRVHHLSRHGVRLRDVKRWLAELRGQDMPESFAWSYKRRYKTYYVWQDLLDEDLITPISDNEYVLKGSEIGFSSPNLDVSSEGKKISMQKMTYSEEEEAASKGQRVSFKEEIQISNQHQTPTDHTKTLSEIEEESPTLSSQTSTLTDDSIKNEEEQRSSSSTIKQDTIDVQHPDEKTVPDQKPSSDFVSALLNRKSRKKSGLSSENPSMGVNTTGTTSSSTTSSSTTKATTTRSAQPSFSKSRSYSNGASNIFKNLISCGAVDTNDSALLMINRRSRNSYRVTQNSIQSGQSAVIIKGEKLGGSQRIFGTAWNQQQQQNSGRKSFDGVDCSSKVKKESGSQKTSSAAYKPVNGPNCSQCGKQFKPEKLHSHMKSCRGMKAFVKGANPVVSAAVDENTPRNSTENHDSVSGYYLTR